MTSWGREDESSSSLSTTSSSQSRRQTSEIDIIAVRNRIVEKIMAKQQREEELRSQQSNTSASKRRSRAPLADLQQSTDDMEMTLRPSTSGIGAELNLSKASAKRGDRIYSSTPLHHNLDPPRQPKKSSQVPGQPKSPQRGRRRRPSAIGEVESGEEEEAPPPPPRAPIPKPPAKKKKGRSKPAKPEAVRPPQRDDSPPFEDVFPPSDDEEQVAVDREEEEEPTFGPSTRQTSRVESPRKASADRAEMPPPSSTAKPARGRNAKPSKATPAKSATKTPTNDSRRSAPVTSAADGSGNRASRSSSRRKTAPRRASPNTRRINAFKEIQKLQTEKGYLIPRLPFMRVVREIATQVSAGNSDFKFTVDAMEALQTATEYYLTGVFTDAASLANHARRVTIMPIDLDLMRKLRLMDA